MSPEELVVKRSREGGIPPRVVRGRCRVARVVRLRAWIAAELRADYGLSYPEIGRVLGGRDHTGIMYLLGKISR